MTIIMVVALRIVSIPSL